MTDRHIMTEAEDDLRRLNDLAALAGRLEADNAALADVDAKLADLLDVAPMKVLTVRQPWAWAIIHAGKWIENRSQRTNYRGTVAIHVSKWWDERAVLELFRSDRALKKHVFANGMPLFDALKCQCGKIIGAAQLVDCCHSENQRVKMPGGTWRVGDSPWYQGPWAWVLTGTAPCVGEWPAHKGSLGLRDLPRGIAERVLASIGEAA